MRIAILNPNTTTSMTRAVLHAAQPVVRAGTQLQGVTAATGAASIESPADEVLGAFALLQAVLTLEASADRPHAYGVACFGDTGLAGVRCAACAWPAFVDEGRRALEQDHAEAIILGCAGLTELVLPLQAALGVPVIEGVAAAAVALTQSLLALGLKASRAGTGSCAQGLR